jgi:3D (Asp-Asp-Asp) domain-containing protein
MSRPAACIAHSPRRDERCRVGTPIVQIVALTTTFFVLGCDDEPNDGSDVPSDPSQPAQTDLAQANQIANAAGGNSIAPRNNQTTTTDGDGDLAVLGSNANQNQQAFREKYGLTDPTQDQLSQWDQYDARLTAYSNKDPDWQYPTASAANWMGTTWTNGDPLAVDFSRIPRGSLIYIPALDMYAEANDTGATGMWANSDAGQTDYGSNGAGRVDVYNLAGDRTSGQVEQDFQNQVRSNEYGPIYIVHRGSGWKTGGN